MANILITYYSRKGENYWNGGIKNLSKGNTEIVAEMIQDTVGGDLFQIETVNQYPADYTQCIEVAKQELRANARPELTDSVDIMDEYVTIFLGYPNWWGTMPMAVFIFLESYNLSGKMIIPFCTNEGSGMGVSKRDLKKNFPTASVAKGLAIHGAEAALSQKTVENWAKNSL